MTSIHFKLTANIIALWSTKFECRSSFVLCCAILSCYVYEKEQSHVWWPNSVYADNGSFGQSFYGAVCPYQHVRHRSLSRVASARSANQRCCVGVATVRSWLTSGWQQVQQWNVYSTVLNYFIGYCGCLELWRVFSVTLKQSLLFFLSCENTELTSFLQDTTVQ